MLLVALFVLHQELQHLTYHQIVAAVRSLPLGRVAVAVLLTVLNYLILSGYELLACHYIGKQQPFSRIALSSFIGNAFANTLGFAFISGSSVKFRLYTAWGLDAAYLLSVLLVIVGVVASLLKGGDYEEALVLGLILLIFLPSRSLFYRKASLFADRFTPGWLLAIGAVFAAITWILLFSYKHMEYAGTEWWTFALEGDIARSLRAQVGIACTCLLVGTMYLLRAGKSQPPAPEAGHLQQIDAIIVQSSETQSNLAYLSGKHFFFSEGGSGFIMFGKGSRSWVSMGDPVCPQDEFAELVWRFREQCDREGVHPVFYEVSKEHLYVYLELGLTILKLGEEAIVDLQRFSLEGASRKNFRNTKNSLEKHGCSFSVHPAAEVKTLLPELAVVSDSWLNHKNTREKRFSLGFLMRTTLPTFQWRWCGRRER